MLINNNNRFQLTLKEGLTVFRDQSFTADMTSEAVKRIDDVAMLRAHQFAEDAGPMAHPIRPKSYVAMDNFYTLTVYEKGAEVIRMYEAIVGRDGFRKGMDLYFERHDGQAVQCDDFRAAMADANNVDLAQFERWYTQAGTPVVTASGAYDAATGAYELTLSQATGPSPGQPEKAPFHIPVTVGLLDGESGDEVLPSTTLQLTEPTATFTLQLPESESGSSSSSETKFPASVVPSLLRGFSAPVRLEHSPPLDDATLAFLASNDTDAFNKWEASFKLATKHLLSAAKMLQESSDEKYDMSVDDFVAAGGLPATLVNSFAATLGADGQPGSDRSLTAYALALPSLSELSDATPPPVDPLALVAARKLVKRALAAANREELEKVYAATAPAEGAPFSIEGGEIGRRQLHNLCLDYLNSIEGR